jgi:hypothetical protein
MTGGTFCMVDSTGYPSFACLVQPYLLVSMFHDLRRVSHEVERRGPREKVGSSLNSLTKSPPSCADLQLHYSRCIEVNATAPFLMLHYRRGSLFAASLQRVALQYKVYERSQSTFCCFTNARTSLLA